MEESNLKIIFANRKKINHSSPDSLKENNHSTRNHEHHIRSMIFSNLYIFNTVLKKANNEIK